MAVNFFSMSSSTPRSKPNQFLHLSFLNLWHPFPNHYKILCWMINCSHQQKFREQMRPSCWNVRSPAFLWQTKWTTLQQWARQFWWCINQAIVWSRSLPMAIDTALPCGCSGIVCVVAALTGFKPTQGNGFKWMLKECRKTKKRTRLLSVFCLILSWF